MQKKPETTSTNETEDNTEQLAREECARLARQLRLMENDKKAYLEESNAAIHQQRKSIRAFEEENRKLEAEIEAHKSKGNEVIEGANLARVLALVDQYIALEEEVKRESKTVHEVGKQLSFASARLAKLRARVEAAKNEVAGGNIARDVSSQELDTKEYTTKKKLQTVTGQYDSIVAENGRLRKEIDKILKENVRVMKRCKELEEASLQNQVEIDDLIDEATNAYDQREEAVAKANVLLERNEKEKKQHVLEMSELKRLIRHEEKLLDFMSRKNQDRIFLETDEERISRLESAKEQTFDDALETYQENLQKLLTPTSPTLKSLVEEYAKLCSENINRFNYINELNNDLELLEFDVDNLREEIKQCATETVDRNQERTAEISKRQEQLKLLKGEHETVESLVGTCSGFMEEIVHLIERMFYITDLEDAKPVLELIGSKQEVSTQNAILYLNILEGRIDEIFSSRRESPRAPIKSVSDISPRPRIVISELDATTAAGDLDSEDELDKSSIVEEEVDPLEYFEMRVKLLDTISLKNPSSASSSVVNEEVN